MSDFETSKEQEDVCEQPRSTYKRRSSVFQLTARRIEESEVTTVSDDETDEKENSEPGELDISTESEPFDLPAYIEKLRNERKNWKETLNARKSRRRKLQKQKAILQRHGADFDLSILSDSERSFLLERPQYERICRNIKTVADAAVKVATLNQEIEVMNNLLIVKMEKKLRSTTKKVIEMTET